MNSSKSAAAVNPAVIALYLPQYHPIPENDAWWGKGFTEWTNVVKARPRFLDHYQPHLPADLGFYDLRLSESRVAQATLAAEYGIGGFCYYHYWFNGRRVLERPFNEVLASGTPDFPFCLCWANENWTRRWDGLDHEVLLQQNYSTADDEAHIRSMLPAFADSRYIKVDGRPVFLVYRVSKLPDPRRTADTWRDEARRYGFHDLYIGAVQGFASERVNPRSFGFDFALEFAPDWQLLGPRLDPSPRQSFTNKVLRKILRRRPSTGSDSVFSYQVCRDQMLIKPDPGYPFYRCATPSWDNSARRSNGATILAASSPALYQEWMEYLLRDARVKNHEFVFVNAWNEWAEGNHLEPCQKFGRSYLEATRNAIQSALTE